MEESIAPAVYPATVKPVYRGTPAIKCYRTSEKTVSRNTRAGKRRKPSRRQHNADKTTEDKCPSRTSSMRSQKKTETGRGQRRNTASRAESKATQRRNRRGPRTADRLTGYRKRRCQAHQQGHGASKGKKSSAEKKVVRIHLSALQGIRN